MCTRTEAGERVVKIWEWSWHNQNSILALPGEAEEIVSSGSMQHSTACGYQCFGGTFNLLLQGQNDWGMWPRYIGKMTWMVIQNDKSRQSDTVSLGQQQSWKTAILQDHARQECQETGLLGSVLRSLVSGKNVLSFSNIWMYATISKVW
jgi:hypothetical protein